MIVRFCTLLGAFVVGCYLALLSICVAQYVREARAERESSVWSRCGCLACNREAREAA